MIQALTLASVVLSVGLVLLIVRILGGRMIRDRHAAREARLRPEIEATMAKFLVGEDPDPLKLPKARGARPLFRLIALQTAAELQGRERARLVETLEKTGIVAETATGLCSRRRRVRREAAEALAQMGSKEAAKGLELGILDRDTEVRVSSAAGLAELADERFVEGVIAEADRDADSHPGAVAAILVTLGRYDPSSLAGALRPGVSAKLRRLATAVVGELRLAEHAPALREALLSDDDELVSRAARGLGRIGDVESVDSLLELNADEDRPPFIAVVSTMALGMIGDPRAVESLERELYRGNWLLQTRAALALKMIGEKGQDVLRTAIGAGNETVRDHARVALG